MDENWDFLLSEFRRLGGIADNVCQKQGKYGRGIFPVDSSMKARIFIPKKLLVKKDDIYLEDNKLRIKKDKEYNQEFIDFFNFYQDNFSWGSGGKETTESFEKGLSLFNSNLKQLLKKYALIDIDARHKGKWDSVITTQFLNARSIKYANNAFIAPIWELVNHKARSFPFFMKEGGLGTPNYPALNQEITFSYNNQSPLKRFFSYGFFSEETLIFSVPFSLPIGEFYICCKGKDLTDDSMKIERFSNKIILDGLPIADFNNPRLPYDYFDEIIKRLGDINITKNLLLKIFQLNIAIRNQIIYESKLIDNQISKKLIEVINYEISLILSHN